MNRQLPGPRLIRCIRVLLGLALVTGLGGCDRAAVPAPEDKQAVAYQLVTERRPVSLADYVRTQKEFYELCKAGADIGKLPVKPFVEVPQDFVMERLTRSSDGKSYFMKQQQYGIDVQRMTPENGCATRIVESVVIERVRDGSVEHVDIDQDGKRVAAEPMRMAPAPSVEGDSDLYTAHRTERGVALKCIASGAAGLAAGGAYEQCIVDPGAGRQLREPNGNLVLAYLREELSGSAGGSASVLAPVSLTLGKVDTAQFDGALN